RAQRVGEAAGAHGLLTDDPEPQRGALVDDPAGGPADPDGGEDEVGVAQGRAEVRRRVDPRWAGELTGELGQDVPDDVEPLLRDVVEPQLVDPQSRVAGRDGLEDLGDAETASADDGELHSVMTSVPWDLRTSSPGELDSGLVTRVSMRSGPHTASRPEPGNLSSSATSTRRSLASRIACLIGTSMLVESRTLPSSRTPLVPRNPMSAVIWPRACSGSDPTKER